MGNYPSYVICIDGVPLEESDGSVTLYQEGSDMELMERFMSIVYLSEDATLITIRKYNLIPHEYTNSLSKEDFIKKAKETKKVC
jgi:acylphosphatase